MRHYRTRPRANGLPCWPGKQVQATRLPTHLLLGGQLSRVRPAGQCADGPALIVTGGCLGQDFIQVVPFQCRIIRLHGLAVVLQFSPTAQALLGEVAATSDRLLPVPGLGLGTCDHVVPFQCRVSVSVLPQPLLVHEKPTAQALLREVAVTPKRESPAPGSGCASCDHLVPFQWKIKVLKEPCAFPTAQTSLAVVAVTPKSPPNAADGSATTDHLMPFQCRTSGV